MSGSLFFHFTPEFVQKSYLSLNRGTLFWKYKSAGNRFVNHKPEAGVETYLTAREVALLLKLSLQTIRRYTMNREIPFHKINRAVRYKQSEIELWFEKRETEKAQTQNKNLDGGLFDETETETGGAV